MLLGSLVSGCSAVSVELSGLVMSFVLLTTLTYFAFFRNPVVLEENGTFLFTNVENESWFGATNFSSEADALWWRLCFVPEPDWISGAAEASALTIVVAVTQSFVSIYVWSRFSFCELLRVSEYNCLSWCSSGSVSAFWVTSGIFWCFLDNLAERLPRSSTLTTLLLIVSCVVFVKSFFLKYGLVCSLTSSSSFFLHGLGDLGVLSLEDSWTLDKLLDAEVETASLLSKFWHWKSIWSFILNLGTNRPHRGQASFGGGWPLKNDVIGVVVGVELVETPSLMLLLFLLLDKDKVCFSLSLLALPVMFSA